MDDNSLLPVFEDPDQELKDDLTEALELFKAVTNEFTALVAASTLRAAERRLEK